MLRYQVHPSDDGRYFIYDTADDKIMSYCGNLILAEKVCRMMNYSPANDSGNLTKTH